MTPTLKEVDEELPSFYESLRLINSDKVTKQYYGIQEHYGFETVNCEVVENMINNSKPLAKKN